MSKLYTESSDLTTLANTIRTKGSTSAELTFPDGFVSAINAIPTGITPTGKIILNDTTEKDVTTYAKATNSR